MPDADEDDNSMPTDSAYRAILGNVVRQVVPPGGQNCSKLTINAGAAT